MTRFMIYMNISLINCYSTKQSTLETSVFGAKFGPIKVRVETLCAIWYKLRMMGIRISGPSYIDGYNMLVDHNALKP